MGKVDCEKALLAKEGERGVRPWSEGKLTRAGGLWERLSTRRNPSGKGKEKAL